MSQLLKDQLELHFLVLLWGFTAVLGLLIEIPPVEVVFYRTLISFIVLGIGLMLIGRQLGINRQGFWQMMVVGVLFAAHWILFFVSARVSNASLCLVGMATTALWSSFIEPVVAHRRISALQVILSIVAIGGITIVLNVEFDRALGLLLAIGSALFAAIFTIWNKYLVRKYNPFVIMFYEMVGAFLATALFLPVYLMSFSRNQLQLIPSVSDWFFLSILAVVCTVYAYSMSVKLMKRISAFMVNFTINLEPVYGIILALLILGDSERMDAGFYYGASLILAAVLAYPVLKKKLTIN